MSAKPLDRHETSPGITPVERAQQWFNDKFDRIINPVVVGGMTTTGRMINTAARGVTQFVRSVFSRS